MKQRKEYPNYKIYSRNISVRKKKLEKQKTVLTIYGIPSNHQPHVLRKQGKNKLEDLFSEITADYVLNLEKHTHIQLLKAHRLLTDQIRRDPHHNTT